MAEPYIPCDSPQILAGWANSIQSGCRLAIKKFAFAQVAFQPGSLSCMNRSSGFGLRERISLTEWIALL